MQSVLAIPFVHPLAVDPAEDPPVSTDGAFQASFDEELHDCEGRKAETDAIGPGFVQILPVPHLLVPEVADGAMTLPTDVTSDGAPESATAGSGAGGVMPDTPMPGSEGPAAGFVLSDAARIVVGLVDPLTPAQSQVREGAEHSQLAMVEGEAGAADAVLRPETPDLVASAPKPVSRTPLGQEAGVAGRAPGQAGDFPWPGEAEGPQDIPSGVVLKVDPGHGARVPGSAPSLPLTPAPVGDGRAAMMASDASTHEYGRRQDSEEVAGDLADPKTAFPTPKNVAEDRDRPGERPAGVLGTGDKAAAPTAAPTAVPSAGDAALAGVDTPAQDVLSGAAPGLIIATHRSAEVAEIQPRTAVTALGPEEKTRTAKALSEKPVPPAHTPGFWEQLLTGLSAPLPPDQSQGETGVSHAKDVVVDVRPADSNAAKALAGVVAPPPAALDRPAPALTLFARALALQADTATEPLSDDGADIAGFAGLSVNGLAVAGQPPAVTQSGGPNALPVPQIAAQISAALRQSADGATELALSPEELGHVRLRLERDARHPERMVVHITFERPETLDLFRRHAGELAEALRDAGYAGADIGFGRQDDTGGSPDRNPGAAAPDYGASLADAPPPEPAAPRLLAGASLDLRL